MWLLIITFIVVLMFGLVVFSGSPYVPSRKEYVKQALTELCPISSSDLLVDIGSGDGVVLREAAKLGARAVGYEINPILVFISRFLSSKYDLVNVRLANFWLEKIPDDTTLIYVFSATRDIKSIIKKIQKETNRVGHQIRAISYGSEFIGVEHLKDVGAYHLYVFYPLQSDKAQV